MTRLMMCTSRQKNMDERLYAAACDGNVQALSDLLNENPLILSKSSLLTSDSPLHIAALRGHTQFADMVITRNPELCRELNQQGYTPIHIASLKGHLDIVTPLLQIDSSGLGLIKDSEGRNPLHCAAVKGRLDVIRHLIATCPESALETTTRNETIFHLVVKYSQPEALNLLISLLRNENVFDGLVNGVDEHGSTPLQLAIARRQNQMTMILSKEPSVNRNSNQIIDVEETIITSDESEQHHGIETMRNGAIVLCTLFATFCFDAVLNPPGGVWHDRPSIDVFKKAYPDGLSKKKNPIFYSIFKNLRSEELLAPNKAMSLALEPNLFLQFVFWDAMCFLSSLTAIALLMVLKPSHKRALRRLVAMTLGSVLLSAVAVYTTMLALVTNLRVSLFSLFMGCLQAILLLLVISGVFSIALRSLES